MAYNKDKESLTGVVVREPFIAPSGKVIYFSVDDPNVKAEKPLQMVLFTRFAAQEVIDLAKTLKHGQPVCVVGTHRTNEQTRQAEMRVDDLTLAGPRSFDPYKARTMSAFTNEGWMLSTDHVDADRGIYVFTAMSPTNTNDVAKVVTVVERKSPGSVIVLPPGVALDIAA